ncbi:MAG: hypothetical protein IPI00_12595 [Flavobacteriales bacterium]|nr:hypothetical protein [Flavobacteriales bacterium]
MKLRNALHWLVLAALVFTVGCAKDEGPVFVPGPPPVVGEPIDTAYFNTEVLPIFTEHCWNCHPTMAELDLGVTEAYNNLVNVPSVNHAPAIWCCSGRSRSIGNVAQGLRLTYIRIEHASQWNHIECRGATTYLRLDRTGSDE